VTPFPLATRVHRAADAAAPINRFLESPLANRPSGPGVANLLFGNPQEMPLEGFVEALRSRSQPQHKDWFAYTVWHPAAQEAVAGGLRARLDAPFDAADVVMTTGAFGGLSLLLTALVEAGDEVIFLSPPWFFYASMILMAGGEPVRVDLSAPDFDLDVEAIARAVSPRTRAVIVNSAQNPTGRVYDERSLRALGDALTEASARHGRHIALLSDESYSRVVFDGRRFVSPALCYPYSFLIYTYGKILLTPGQRIGYIALPPTLPDRAALRQQLLQLQMVHGWTFPNAVMQYAVPDLERLSIDREHLQRKRDVLVDGLRALGYQATRPESTFYVLAQTPTPDADAFCAHLAERDVLVMPGTLFNLPGYVRLSLTASDDMIGAALDAFEKLRIPEP
jgi:aspartate aminotransferase